MNGPKRQSNQLFRLVADFSCSAKKMKTHTEIKDVFLAYGEAAYHAQLMEYDLISIWMIDSVTQGVSLTRLDLLRFQEDWSKKTFGQLLNPLQKSNLILPEIKTFLEQIRVTRNRLMHGFFLDYTTDLQTDDGRKTAVAHLHRIKTVLQKGQQLFSDIANAYLKDFGIDTEEIRRQIFQKNEDAEP
ncbi:MAG: hypothetical protein D4R67_10650 [Bacteroidetes bacterium]|nr:MAG: hypothetical protein D4R67_10650 [Bacteroidota bacterium]